MLVYRRERGYMLHELTYYMMTHGLWLTYAYLTSAIFLLLKGEDSHLASWYAAYMQSMAAVLLGASLIGALLLEDILRKVR